MNKYEIEDIISGDSARDEKQIEKTSYTYIWPSDESNCEWCDTKENTITDYSGMNLCSDCNNDGGYN